MNSVLQAFVHAPGNEQRFAFIRLINFVFIVLRDCFLLEKHHCELKDNNHSMNNCIMCQLRQLYHHVSSIFSKRSLFEIFVGYFKGSSGREKP